MCSVTPASRETAGTAGQSPADDPPWPVLSLHRGVRLSLPQDFAAESRSIRMPAGNAAHEGSPFPTAVSTQGGLDSERPLLRPPSVPVPLAWFEKCFPPLKSCCVVFKT